MPLNNAKETARLARVAGIHTAERVVENSLGVVVEILAQLGVFHEQSQRLYVQPFLYWHLQNYIYI